MSENVNSGGFSMPEGYGDAFARKLAHRLECVEELAECRTLQDLKNVHGFITPENYFETATELLQLQSLIQLKDAGIFLTPADYFEQGAPALATLLRIDALKGADTGFTLPADYFSSVTNRALEMPSGKTARIISLFTVSKWAAAAVLLALLGAWLFRGEEAAPDADCMTVACLQKRDLIKSRAIEYLSEDDLMQVIDDGMLEDQLLETGMPQDDSLHSTSSENAGT